MPDGRPEKHSLADRRNIVHKRGPPFADAGRAGLSTLCVTTPRSCRPVVFCNTHADCITNSEKCADLMLACVERRGGFG